MTDCRADPLDLVGSDGCAYAASAQKDAALHEAPCHGVCKRNSKIWIIIVAVILIVAEVNDVVPFRTEQRCNLLFHFVSAMIRGYAYFHLFSSDSDAVRSGS